MLGGEIGALSELTVKLCVTGWAGAQSSLPGWLMVTEQLPPPSRTTLPFWVAQLPLAVKTGARPEVADPFGVKGGSVSGRDPRGDPVNCTACWRLSGPKV